MDNKNDRLVLVTQDLVLRGKQITFAHTKSSKSTKIQTIPRRNEKEQKVSLCHLMNDRYGALTLEGCDIELLFRERLKADDKLTNCETKQKDKL